MLPPVMQSKEDGGEEDEGNGTSAAETMEKLPKYSFSNEKYSLPPSNPVYVLFDVETNGISSALNKRMCSIAAQVYNKDGVLISVNTKSDFNSKIKIDRKMHATWGTGIHGMTYKELQKERLFGPVFDSFLAFIEARRGASSEVVLVAHNGVTCDFRLLVVEMARHKRVFPATLNIHLYDTYAAIKKFKANKSLDYWQASIDDWPKRGAKSKGYEEHGTPKMQVPDIVNFILKKRSKFAPNEDTFVSYCGAAHDALADVKGLALIAFDKEGLGTKIKLKHFFGPLVVEHLLLYADKLLKHETYFLQRQLKRTFYHAIERPLKISSMLALCTLVCIYVRAGLHGDLWSNQNWTISNVMVYPYNKFVTNFLLFPCFLTMCIFYSFKLDLTRVRIGSTVAVVGGIGLMMNPVTTNQTEHIVCAFIVFLSSYFWYPECNAKQFQTFSVSTFLFFGGFALDFAVNGTKDMRSSSSVIVHAYQFLPSVCCMLGELGIFITWGQMVQNPLSQKKLKRK